MNHKAKRTHLKSTTVLYTAHCVNHSSAISHSSLVSSAIVCRVCFSSKSPKGGSKMRLCFVRMKLDFYWKQSRLWSFLVTHPLEWTNRACIFMQCVTWATFCINFNKAGYRLFLTTRWIFIHDRQQRKYVQQGWLYLLHKRLKSEDIWTSSEFGHLLNLASVRFPMQD